MEKKTVIILVVSILISILIGWSMSSTFFTAVGKSVGYVGERPHLEHNFTTNVFNEDVPIDFTGINKSRIYAVSVQALGCQEKYRENGLLREEKSQPILYISDRKIADIGISQCEYTTSQYTELVEDDMKSYEKIFSISPSMIIEDIFRIQISETRIIVEYITLTFYEAVDCLTSEDCAKTRLGKILLQKGECTPEYKCVFDLTGIKEKKDLPEEYKHEDEVEIPPVKEVWWERAYYFIYNWLSNFELF